MAVDTTTTVEHAMTVNGEEVPTGETYEVINPSTGQSFATVSPPAPSDSTCSLTRAPMQAPHASEADVDAAVASAKEAFAGWAATPIEERKAIMLKAHDALKAHSAELLELLVTEQGKPMDAAEAEFNLSLDNIKMHATEFELPVEDLGTNETHKTVVLRKPVGVVAGITPCAPTSRTSPPAAHPPRAGGTSRSSAPCRSGPPRSPAATPSSSSPAP